MENSQLQTDAHKELLGKLRQIEVKAAELIKLADSIDAGVYPGQQRAAVELMQNMLRRWRRWQLREALIAFGIAECHLPCPQKGMIEAIEKKLDGITG